jgi:lysyl-tRNA synthetase class 2
MINDDVFLLAKKMSKALQVIRGVLYDRSFHEFITGVLQENFEAGQAQAFITKCRANDKNYHLSLTSELKLKRLLVAGFEKVFEISQSFRNEGIDSIHSPEFSMLEVYQSQSDVYQMLDLLEDIVCQVVEASEGDKFLSYCQNGKTEHVNYKKPFKRLTFKQAFSSVIGPYDWCNLERMVEIYPESFSLDMTRFTWLMKVIEKFIVPTIKEPTFLTELPIGMSPFVKNKNQEVSERAFLISQQTFLADIYTDENDALVLSQLLKEQSEALGANLNSEYLEIIKMGLPQTAGIGLGLNRLFMLMLGNLPSNIKETILYPIV